ncbi:MAG: hypothetical protein QM756_43325 [Polyangiaceae bacterium]
MRLSLILPLVLALSACDGTCTNTTVARVPAPEGGREAVLFRRDCGATTGFATHVSILPVGAEAEGAGNTFRADSDHGAASLGDWDSVWAEARWLAPNHLLVRHAAHSRIFRQEEEVSGVRVTYESVER